MVRAADISLKFRDGVPDDAGTISALGKLTFADFFGQIYRRADLDAYLDKYFSIERVRSDLDNPEIDYRIAVTSSSMVGYAKIGPTNLPLNRDTSSILQLHRLYVRETRQGVGVGGILLSWAIERARERGATELCLGVWSNNENAINMYDARGFVAEGEHEIEVGQVRDKELIMSRKLKEKVSAR